MVWALFPAVLLVTSVSNSEAKELDELVNEIVGRTYNPRRHAELLDRTALAKARLGPTGCSRSSPNTRRVSIIPAAGEIFRLPQSSIAVSHSPHANGRALLITPGAQRFSRDHDDTRRTFQEQLVAVLEEVEEHKRGINSREPSSRRGGRPRKTERGKKTKIRELAQQLAISGHLVADSLVADADASTRTTWQGFAHQVAALTKLIKELAAQGRVSAADTAIAEAKIKALSERIQVALQWNAQRRIVKTATLLRVPFQTAVLIRPATPADALQITDLVNIGLMADDAFFTKPEFVNRLTFRETQSMIEEQALNEGADMSAVRFLVAEKPDLSSGTSELHFLRKAEKHNSHESTLVGCVRIDMPTYLAPTTSSLALDEPTCEAQFGMLAAPPGGTGISLQLIEAAEDVLARAASRILESKSAALSKATLRIIVPVINLREDLIDFYTACGYQRSFRFFRDHPDFPDIPDIIIRKEWLDRVRLRILFKDVEVGRHVT